MLFEYTLYQLQMKSAAPERAEEFGQLGYMQWLADLPADGCYLTAANKAHLAAASLKRTEPAVAVYCDLLRRSIIDPFCPLDLKLPRSKRRGGARNRRRERAL